MRTSSTTSGVAVSRFVRDEVVPLEPQIEERDEIPERIRKAAADMGLFGFAMPEEYGGLGLSMDQEAQLVFELGYTTPALRSMFGTNNGIAGHVLMLSADRGAEAGLPAQLASGEWTASFALTEPDAGSDPAGLTTSGRARRRRLGHQRHQALHHQRAGRRRLHGVRAHRPEAPADQGHLALPGARADTTGVTVGPKDHKMGQAGAWTADVYLDDVRVGRETLIGAEGVRLRDRHGVPGPRPAAHRRAVRRPGPAAGRRVRRLRHRARAGRQADRAAPADPGPARRLPDRPDGRPRAGARGRPGVRRGADTKLGPACAKYFASEMVGRVADRAVQIHGGAGYMRGVAVERFYRDARLFRIYEGTSQIQQLVIARAVLKQFQGIAR